MDSSRIQVISRKLIKPSSPTPPHLSFCEISLLDQLTTALYIPIAIFFPKIEANNVPIAQILENSLSDLLTFYYPFAGKVGNNLGIDCNDEGATFLEVNIDCPMSEIAGQADCSAQDIVFPRGLPWGLPEDGGSQVVVQLSHFDCGGKALSLGLSHKMADGCTAFNFFDDWATLTRQSGEKPSPEFTGSSLFPPSNNPPTVMFEPMKIQGVTCKRFQFDAKSLAELKARVATETGVHNPTRVEVVTALVYKSAMAATTEKLQRFKPSHLGFVANLRPLTTPPIPPSSVGNFYYYLDASISNEEEINISRLAKELRRVKVELQEKCKKLKPSELLPVARETDEKMPFRLQKKMYFCSSFCGFKSNQLDFGWGPPERVILGASKSRNSFLLMDDQDGGGVQAMVCLDEDVMPIFERDEDILKFASLKIGS